MAEPKRPHAAQRRLWLGREGHRIAVCNLFDVYKGEVFEVATLLGIKELLCAAHDSSLQAGPVGLLLQVESIPLADHASDCGRIVVAAKEREGGATDAGVDVHEQDSPIIARPGHVRGHERVPRVRWVTRGIAVQ